MSAIALPNQVTLPDQFLDQYPDFPAHMNPLATFVYLRTYSRFLSDKGRREVWKETVKRASQYNVNLGVAHLNKLGIDYDPEEFEQEAALLFDNMFNTRQFLSGRTLWVGGAETGVADKFPLANFNCSFLNIESYSDLGDLFYLLLVGTGVGFKATKEMARALPPVRTDIEIVHQEYVGMPKKFRKDDTELVELKDGVVRLRVGDSKEGWVDALRYYFSILSNDDYSWVTKIIFDYNHVRPKGERLVTFGGTASGYEPLHDMFAGFDRVVHNQIDPSLDPLEKVGENKVRLRPIHLLDIGNLVGNNVVVGGVRRTAEIFLLDADDYESMFAKFGLNGIWGDDGFAYVEEVETKLKGLGIAIPRFFADLHRRQYLVYPDPMDFQVYEKFDTPEEATKRAKEHYGQVAYVPYPCHVDRKEQVSHRKMSNNSVAFLAQPKRKMLNLLFTMMKKEGEPGFINLYEAAKRRLQGMGLKNPSHKLILKTARKLGLNPCAEILLQSYGVCNLTTVNVLAFVRPDNTLDLAGLLEAQRLSARAGIRMTLVTLELPHWNEVQEIDRLTGLSLTGWKDAIHRLGYTEGQEENLLKMLSGVGHEESESYARRMRVTVPLLDTTVKPEGTQSQVAGGVSSGLHEAHSEFYIRRVRINADDPLAKAVLSLEGWTVNPENDTPGATREEQMKNARTLVIDFPVYSGSRKTKDDVKVDEQFDTYFRFQNSYTAHNSSNTIHVHPDQWGRAEERVWDGWDNFVGVSFLAHDGGTYKLAPYEAIDETRYQKLVAEMEDFDMSILTQFEVGRDVELENSDGCDTGICPTR